MSAVQGWDELQRRLSTLVDRLDLGKALSAGGYVLEGLAKIHCPVDTGNLRASIQTKQMPSPPGTGLVHVGTHVEYAAAVEFGYVGPVNVRAHTRQISQAWGRPIAPTTVQVSAHVRNVNRAAKPYLRPAFDEGKTVAVAAIQANLVAQMQAVK